MPTSLTEGRDALAGMLDTPAQKFPRRYIATCVGMLALCCFADTALDRGLVMASLLTVVGRAAFEVPNLYGVGIAFTAFAMFAAACSAEFYMVRGQPPRMLAFVALTSFVAAIARYNDGMSISMNGWFVIVPITAFGIWTAVRSWNLWAGLATCVSLGFWTVLVGADFAHLWGNRASVAGNFIDHGTRLSIGGAGWMDGLFLVPILSVLIVMMLFTCVAVPIAMMAQRERMRPGSVG